MNHRLKILEFAESCQVIGWCPTFCEPFEMRLGRGSRDLGVEYDLYCPHCGDMLIETDSDKEKNIQRKGIIWAEDIVGGDDK